MNAKAFSTIGIRLADRIFSLRERKGRRQAEIHVTRDELAAMLALAVEEGWKRGRGIETSPTHAHERTNGET